MKIKRNHHQMTNTLQSHHQFTNRFNKKQYLKSKKYLNQVHNLPKMSKPQTKMHP